LIARPSTVAAFAVSALLCVYVARATEPVVTSEDIAVAEIYTDLATHGQLLLGPYSRFGWHHPGPLYFYLQAPLYAASNREGASLFVGAVAINLTALAILLWTIVRQARPALAVVVGVACLAFALRAPRLLASPWTPHVTILPALACLALAAAVASGRTRLLAATALVASFVVQTDLAFVPPLAIVCVLTMGAVLRRAVREKVAPVRELVLASCASAAVWAPPMVDAVRHRGGNLVALARFFTRPDAPLHSMREALGAWCGGLAGLARADMALAWGGPLHSEAAVWTVLVACALIVLLAIVAYAAARRDRVFDAWLATMTLAAALVSLWSLTRVRDDYTDHEVFWLGALGAMAAAVAFSGLTECLPSRAPTIRRWARFAPPILIGAALIAAAFDFASILGMERRSSGQRDVPPAVDAIEAHLDREHSRSALVDVDTAWAQGAPIVLRLRQHHRRVTVSTGSLFIFTDAFAPTGKEDTQVRIRSGAGAGGAADAGWQQLFDSYWANVYAR
jgi:hypothetical protein